MKIVFDNIVFGIQKSGGVSLLWYELLKSAANRKYELAYLDYDKNKENIFNKLLNIPKNLIINLNQILPLKIERYINPKLIINDESFIFHSSYYRYSTNVNAINVTLVHDFTYEFFYKGLQRKIHSLQKKQAILNSHGIICISENTKKDLLRFYPGIDQSKIRVIYNGVSESYFRIADDLLDDFPEFHSLRNKKVLLYVGHRSSYKNFDKVVDAMKFLNDDYLLVIVGEQLNDLELKNINSNLSSHQYMIFSKIGNEKLNVLYNISFAFLYPSSYEGFGIPILEAMKTGCPVVTTRFSSIPEVAGDAAVYLDNIEGESIVSAVKFLDDDFFRQQIINKGYEQAKLFSWDKTIAEYFDFYEDLFKK